MESTEEALSWLRFWLHPTAKNWTMTIEYEVLALAYEVLTKTIGCIFQVPPVCGKMRNNVIKVTSNIFGT
jgi:hypothetical protein